MKLIRRSKGAKNPKRRAHSQANNDSLQFRAFVRLMSHCTQEVFAVRAFLTDEYEKSKNVEFLQRFCCV